MSEKINAFILKKDDKRVFTKNSLMNHQEVYILQ